MSLSAATTSPLAKGVIPQQGANLSSDAQASGATEAVTRSAQADCSHCGLVVPRGLLEEGAVAQFCCSGCRAVFQLLRGAGLQEYYGFRERIGEVGRPALDVTPAGAEQFDAPVYHQLYCTPGPLGQLSTELLLEGVHCAACVWLVERVGRLEPAVRSARLDMGRSVLTLEWNPEEAPLSQIAATLTKMGYRPRPSRRQEALRMHKKEQRDLLLRMGVAGAVAGNVMLMAFALYSGSVGFDEAKTMDEGTQRFFEVLSLVVSLPALWAAGLFFRGAVASLRTRTPHMDLPIALGIAVGFLWGTYGALSGQGEIYFDSVTALIFFLLVGRYISRRHQLAASDAAELLFAVVPGMATVVDEQGDAGTGRSTPTDEVLVGALVLVQSGEVISVDGYVVNGHSSLDKALLSGESRPVEVSAGDAVEAGALNLGSRLVIRAEKSGRETRVARLMREVERATRTRTRLVAQADRIAGIFTVSVLLLALVVGVAWSLSAPQLGIERALSLLIVACPCALGLATPLALSAGVSQAARARKLIFNPEALEQLAEPSVLVLDKTGTLTEGQLSVTDFFGDAQFAAAAWELEQGATHPIAPALRAFFQSQLEANVAQPLSDEQREEVRSHRSESLGGGLCSQLCGAELLIGSVRYVSERAELPREMADQLAAAEPASSPVLIAWRGRVRAMLWAKDTLRADVASNLKALRAQGFELHLLSGDHSRVVEAVADELRKTTLRPDLFASVRSEVSPEQKQEALRRMTAEGRKVIMVGDGVNDAGALAQASVGIAVRGAAEAARMSADVYLAEAGVSELRELLEGSRRVLQTIRRGIGFSLAYNVVGISLAASGALSPLWAAVLMPLSSLTVVTNAYRSTMFRRPDAS